LQEWPNKAQLLEKFPNRCDSFQEDKGTHCIQLVEIERQQQCCESSSAALLWKLIGRTDLIGSEFVVNICKQLK
jgi:hypothetical protein